MPIFRQFIEWSVLNTGVILRERPRGKKIWTALKLKCTLAEQLAFLGSERQDEDRANSSEEEHSSEDNDDRVLLNPMRLQKHVCHVPEQRKKRGNCRVHRRRKTTRFFCKTCNRYMCLNVCWKNYHTKRKYIYDDPSCVGRVLHETAVD